MTLKKIGEGGGRDKQYEDSKNVTANGHKPRSVRIQ